MIVAGFLAASLASVVNEDAVRWDFFGVGLFVGVGGIALVRIGRRQEATAGGRLASNMQAIETSLGRIVENMAKLNEQKRSINTYDVRHRIDETFADDLATFVEARHSIGHIHGLNAYADVMSCFAAGERYLNRVWSASADGYIDEVNAYLDKAHEQFTESLEKVRRLKT